MVSQQQMLTCLREEIRRHNNRPNRYQSNNYGAPFRPNQNARVRTNNMSTQKSPGRHLRTTDGQVICNKCHDGSNWFIWCWISARTETWTAKLINEFGDIFTVDKTDFGFTDLVQHRIHVGDHSPIKSKPYRVPFSQRPITEEQIKTMLEKSIIRPSTSPWSSNVVLVAKKDGSRRFCIDFRKLNKITKKETYPLPRIDETLHALGRAQYFSTLDLAAGYWQIGMAPDDIEKTAFTTISSHFEFVRMPFGLCNAPPRCQQLMDFLLAGLQWEICLCYLDDIIIYPRTFTDHLSNLRTVFERLRAAGLKVRLTKCTFCRSEVPYLGHIISKDGIKADPSKIAIVRDYPIPTTVKEVRQFIGFTVLRRIIASSLKTSLQSLLPYTNWQISMLVLFGHSSVRKPSICYGKV